MDRLCYRVEPFAILFCVLGIVLANTYLTLPAGPALLHRCTQRMSLQYMVIVDSMLNEDALSHPLFISRYIIHLWAQYIE